jgi:hypothetical protein
MATFRTFCYNPSPNPAIPGTEQVGDIAAANGDVTIDSGKEWWNGPDETNGYIVAYKDISGDRSNAPERVLSTNYPCHVGFMRSAEKTEASFIDLANYIAGTTSFVFGTQSKLWLNNNGYWTSWLPPQPYLYLEEIATYLRNYMADFRNPNFYYYWLDGDGTYISDGGGDQYDSGNMTTPWLLSGVQYTSNSGDPGSFPYRINYTNTTDTIVDTDFYYVSLGYTQFTLGSQSGVNHPLTVIGSRVETGPVGWQVGGNSGADGGGTLASGTLWNGTMSNGFTTYAFYRQTYNAGDPSHCNVVILLGHTNWASQFGSINSFADPTSGGGNGVYYYTASASNILTIQTLLSKPSGQQVTAAECKVIIDKYTQRIKEALSY